MKYANCPSTNVFHIKVDKELYSAMGWRCRQNPKLEIFTPSFTEYIKKLHESACRTCCTIIFPPPTNHIIDLLRCRCCCRHCYFNSLMLFALPGIPYSHFFLKRKKRKKKKKSMRTALKTTATNINEGKETCDLRIATVMTGAGFSFVTIITVMIVKTW